MELQQKSKPQKRGLGPSRQSPNIRASASTWLVASREFRKLIAKYHPDVTGSDSREYQEMAQLINAAYSLLKSEDFFLTRTVSEVLWKELINESVFTSRNVYAPYHMDIDAGDLYQKVTHGKYMWDPEEEEFSLFLRSIYHAARDLLDAAESECRVSGYTDELRASFQERLFHCLAMQFVEPAECLSKIADPETIDKYGRKIYRFRAFVGERQKHDMVKRIASLQPGEMVYPKSLRFGEPRHEKSPGGGAERQWRSFSTDRSGSGEARPSSMIRKTNHGHAMPDWSSPIKMAGALDTFPLKMMSCTIVCIRS